jgi:hypothetical protein
MRALLSMITILLIASLSAAEACSVTIGLDVTPDGTDARVVQAYSFDCRSNAYSGQATNVRLNLPWRIEEISVSDSKGLLLPAPLDPEFYKFTVQDSSSALSVIPRNAILLAPFGSTYSLSTSYTVPDVIGILEDTSKLLPRNIIVLPGLRIDSDRTTTSFTPDVSSYQVTLNLPEGAELRASGKCTLKDNVITCPVLDSAGIAELEISWRDKTMPEKLMRKGWPWFILSLKSSLGGIFGFLG